MINFINGWKHPIFKIYSVGIGRVPFLIDTIHLPITDSSGLIESTSQRKVIHEFTDFSLEQKVYGSTIHWRLPYSEYANVTTMMKIQDIYRHSKAGRKIVLIPRADLLTRKFEVLYTGESLDYGIKKGGVNSIGNRLVVIEFTTKNLVDDTGWIDPNQIVYATWYNHNYFSVLQV